METSAVPSTPATDAPTVLEAQGLRKRFGDREALKGVSLSVTRGELAAVIGPNGAGKTTLLSILAGIQTPDGGSVSKAPRPRSLRRKLGASPLLYTAVPKATEYTRRTLIMCL